VFDCFEKFNQINFSNKHEAEELKLELIGKGCWAEYVKEKEQYQLVFKLIDKSKCTDEYLVMLVLRYS